MPPKEKTRRGGRVKDQNTADDSARPEDRQPRRLPRADHLKASIPPVAFYTRELPGAPTLKAVRDQWSQNIRCPFHEDPTPSFGVNLRTGAFRCFGCDANGGSIIDFAMMADGLSFDDACAALADRYHVEPGTAQAAPPPRSSPPKSDPEPPRPATLTPIPADALATRPTEHPKHGAPSQTWTYTDADGHPVAYVHRFDPDRGRKVFSPQTWTAADGWQWRAPPKPRPLYRLQALATRPDAPVCVCEGEKAADAAAELLPDMVTSATMNGANAAGLADLSPLAGRHVKIWPDADDPGARYARIVADLATAAGAASVEVLDLASITEAPGDA
ncbi:CHC2 zinc finger domain-containing protein [uncultured Thiohalocapsa sp.]|uniref:CHC2 zinc finger domain-containing protein n=1 Tax=uncultured Thiohalocapsa sp. TaxID=768990 RepID=UPI0025FC5FCE|nr:CHC2 zinc finger domain-containing protein [uncultured Thiohalocapsa sp.]